MGLGRLRVGVGRWRARVGAAAPGVRRRVGVGRWRTMAGRPRGRRPGGWRRGGSAAGGQQVGVCDLNFYHSNSHWGFFLFDLFHELIWGVVLNLQLFNRDPLLLPIFLLHLHPLESKLIQLFLNKLIAFPLLV